MPPSAKQMAKFQKALEQAREVFDDVDVSSIKLPFESTTDIVREAVSVIAYFDMKEAFTEETCRGCGMKFAYAYYTTSVKHCSVLCLKKTLESLGLVWNPSKPYEERWGSRYVPAIVPSVVYSIIQEQAPPEVALQEEPEPVEISDEAKNLIAMLNELS